MYLLCNRKFCFSFQFASYVFTEHQSKIAFTQHLNVHFYFQQYSQLLHSAMYILCYVNETYLQPMFLLCDILIQFCHDIKATQLLHKHICSLFHSYNDFSIRLTMRSKIFFQKLSKLYVQAMWKLCHEFLPLFLLLKTAQLLSRFRLTSENIAFSIQKNSTGIETTQDLVKAMYDSLTQVLYSFVTSHLHRFYIVSDSTRVT